MSDIAIRCEGLSKQYRIGKRYRALRDVLTDALPAPFRALGSAFRNDRNGTQNSALSTQDSGLCPWHSGLCFCLFALSSLNGAILGMKPSEIERRFDEIVAFAETDKFWDTPVKHYSGGMYVWLAFAVAAHHSTTPMASLAGDMS